MVNVLLGERVSRDKGDKTDSIERQHEKHMARVAERRAAGEVINIVGVAEDRSVSGDIDFFDRPELGEWLTDERRGSWDELWMTTQDRLSRNDMHVMAFIHKMLEWDKVLVLLDDPTLDMHTPEGRAIIHVKSIGPARELERIRTRIRDSIAKRKYTEAWVGGIPPWCYTTDWGVVAGKKRRIRVLDEYSVLLAHDLRNRLIDDEDVTFKDLAWLLNDRGELTPKDLWRSRQIPPEPIKGEKWHGHGIKQHLTSLTLLGYKMETDPEDRWKRRPVADKDGKWLRVADPVFTDHEWETLQSAIKEREGKKGVKKQKSPMLGVVFCGKCNRSAYQIKNTVLRDPQFDNEGLVVVGANEELILGEDGAVAKVAKTYRYYRCNAQPKGCQGVGMVADDVESLVEQTFLEREGDQQIKTREWQEGSDNEKELKDLERRIERLREDRENGAFDNDPKYYAAKLNEYTMRKNQLEGEPKIKSGWKYSDTGVTFRQAWVGLSVDEKRRLLLRRGVRFTIHDRSTWETFIPDDWPDAA
ncbi:recombinase family protein [Lentzea flava]|uniref:Recombinase family protein n=1 Tax=Lentzea flava TaxID=103732 RepID=A0ABQ2UN84_9PSEU|nr:recombinase family protein [Lentzea flava]MCP2200078.1 Site-specific DNA recombinase [Lentzea flava]GGU45970.1 recombinase family protein [Lentzea flava]